MIKMFVYKYRKVKRRIKANGKAHSKRESITPLYSHLLYSACCLLDCCYIIIYLRIIFIFCIPTVSSKVSNNEFIIYNKNNNKNVALFPIFSLDPSGQ